MTGFHIRYLSSTDFSFPVGDESQKKSLTGRAGKDYCAALYCAVQTQLQAKPPLVSSVATLISMRMIPNHMCTVE